MKKILFLILASFLVLAACGNEEESKLDDTKETKSEDKESTKDDKESDEEKDKSDEKQKSDDKSSEEVATQDESTEEAQSQEQVNTQEQQSTQQPVQSQEQTQQAPVKQPIQELQGGNDAGAAEEQQAFLRESDPEYYEQFEGKTGEDLPEGPNGHYGITPTSEYSYSNDQLGPDGLPREDAIATDENGNPEPQ